MSKAQQLAEKLKQYIPNGDGYNSDFANDLAEAVDLLKKHMGLENKMSKVNNGGPAFPHDGQADYTGGLTLRDYFAAKAVQGFCAHGGSGLLRNKH